MEIKNERDAFDAVNALGTYLNERLTDARFKSNAFQKELNSLNEQIKFLETKLTSLNLLKIGWPQPQSPAASLKPATTVEDSLKVVVSILGSSAGPMRVKSIAEYAHGKGLITSSNGLDGVASIVSNTLSRYSPRIFTRAQWGWWSLNEKQLTEAQLANPANGNAAA